MSDVFPVTRRRATESESGADGFDTFAGFYAVYRAVLLARRDPRRAEDAVQEAFARAYAAWDRVCLHPNPVGWVARVALNESASVARRLRRESLDPPEPTAPAAERALDAGLIRLVWALPRRSIRSSRCGSCWS
jgi:DNA-directed RNA polymerase specialized sigma24 family protein